MKKKGKSLFSYLFILIGIALGVFAICIAILVLSPGKAIAGFVYNSVSTDKAIYARVNSSGEMLSEKYYSSHITDGLTMLKDGDVDKVIINAGCHDVQIRCMEQEQAYSWSEHGMVNAVDYFAFSISTHYSGIYKAEKYPNGIDFNIKYDASTKILTINFETPDGLNFNNTGDIIVDLPQAYCSQTTINSVVGGTNVETSKSISINTTKGSVRLGGINQPGQDTKTFALPNVDIKTQKGGINISEYCNVYGASLNIESESGQIDFYNPINQPNMTVNISSGSGKVDLQTNNANLTVKELNLYSSKADIKVNNITLPSSDSVINWSGERGRLFANEIVGSLIGKDDSSATNFDIKSISGQFFLPKGDYCDVTLGKVDGKVKIVSKKNNIIVKNASSTVVIETQKGSVELENCTKSVDVTATKASVNLIECSGEIRVATNGKITGSILGLTGTNNYLKTEKSNINVSFNQTLAFNLSASSSRKDVKIDYASVSKTDNNIKDFAFNGGDTNKAITLTAKKEIAITNYIGE